MMVGKLDILIEEKKGIHPNNDLKDVSHLKLFLQNCLSPNWLRLFNNKIKTEKAKTAS